MPIKIHICDSAAEAQRAVNAWGETNLISIGEQPTDDVQVFTDGDVLNPLPAGDFVGLKKFVAIFKV
jgi:hypothetical protein